MCSAFIALKADTATGPIAPSAPPASITSASPRWIMWKAAPPACEPVAQAVAVAMFTPCRLKRMLVWPAQAFTMSRGTTKGLTLRGPPSISRAWFASIVSMPPMPLPIATPRRSKSPALKSMPQSRAASTAAPRPYRQKRSIRFASRPSTPMCFSGSKPFTSPPKRVGQSGVVGKFVIGPMPDRPSSRLCQKEGTSMPTSVTAPRPVTTTRRSVIVRGMRGAGRRAAAVRTSRPDPC